MKRTFTIFFLVIGYFSFGQTKTIKFKKPTKQSEMTSVVTLCGIYYGKTTQKSILANNRLTISNNKDNLKIISFEITFFAQGAKTHIIAQKGDTLGQVAINELLSRDLDRLNIIYIAPIRAVNSNKDTVFLNPIDIKLTKD